MESARRPRPLDVRLPRVEAYNLTVERQIAAIPPFQSDMWGMSDATSVAGSGDGFNYNVNAPAFIPGLANQNLAKPFFAKYGWTQGIDFYCMCLTNYYNSLQAQVKRTFAGGYGLQAELHLAGCSVVDSPRRLHDKLQPRTRRGRENSIPDHSLIIAQNYDIPFGRGRKYGANMNRFVDYAVGGWNIDGATTFYTGMPFTPHINSYPSGTVRPYTGPNNRPDKGTGSPYASDQNRDHWLNVGPGGTLSSAFVIPADNTFGNYGIQHIARADLYKPGSVGREKLQVDRASQLAIAWRSL